MEYRDYESLASTYCTCIRLRKRLVSEPESGQNNLCYNYHFVNASCQLGLRFPGALEKTRDSNQSDYNLAEHRYVYGTVRLTYEGLPRS